jgi:hypothetical protein
MLEYYGSAFLENFNAEMFVTNRNNEGVRWKILHVPRLKFGLSKADNHS